MSSLEVKAVTRKKIGEIHLTNHRVACDCAVALALGARQDLLHK